MKKAPRTCKGCGKPEQVDAIGYSNIAPYLGYCTDCINAAMDAIRNEEKNT